MEFWTGGSGVLRDKADRTMLQGPWRIELFGGLRAVQGDRVITRFRTEKTGVLLAYLAVHRERSFSREELIELLWPEADIDHGRMSLRTALSSLRRQLEPPVTAAFGVLAADPSQVRLNPAAIQTDVAEFERALESASEAQDDAERARLTATAAALYRGELLSGYYDDWIVPERERLAASHLEALRRLIRHHAQARELSRALGYAHAALQIDSLNEDLHRDVARLYLALGRSQAAAGQLEVLSRILRDELGRPPSEATRQLSEELTRR